MTQEETEQALNKQIDALTASLSALRGLAMEDAAREAQYCFDIGSPEHVATAIRSLAQYPVGSITVDYQMLRGVHQRLRVIQENRRGDDGDPLLCKCDECSSCCAKAALEALEAAGIRS